MKQDGIGQLRFEWSEVKKKKKQALVGFTFSGFLGNVRPSEMLGH